MRRNQAVLALTEKQRSELSRWAQSRALPAGDVFRARLILALAKGESYRQIMASLQTTAPTVSRWEQRVGADGIDGGGPARGPRATRAVSRAWPRRRCRLASRERHNRNPLTEARIGRAVRWRRRS